MIEFSISIDCTYYKIEDDSWHIAPDLNEKRFYNSSCSQGDFIYTVGGTGYGKQLINSIERLNVKSLLNDNND